MRKIPHLRWIIIGLIFLATTINYIDRQAIAVVAPIISKEFNMSPLDYSWLPFSFFLSYSIMQIFSGRLIDFIGTKRGTTISIIWWSVANMMHAFGSGVASFSVYRFLLGIGEAGNLPAGMKAVTEWFPKKEHTTAVGILGAGVGLGAILAPPLVTFLTVNYGWRFAFIFTGGLGFVWFIAWQLIYEKPEKHPRLSEQEFSLIKAGQDVSTEEEPPHKWTYFLQFKEVWGLMLARFIGDGVFYFFVFWLPKYLVDVRQFEIKEIGMFAWIPFLAADIGSLFSGWLGGFWLRQGKSIDFSRKVGIWLGALIVPIILLASSSGSPYTALGLIAIGMFAIQIKSVALFTIPMDLFKSKDAAFVWGLSGAAGSFGGMIFQPVIGLLVGSYSYTPVFWIAAFLHIISALVVMALIPKIENLEGKN